MESHRTACKKNLPIQDFSFQINHRLTIFYSANRASVFMAQQRIEDKWLMTVTSSATPLYHAATYKYYRKTIWAPDGCSPERIKQRKLFITPRLPLSYHLNKPISIPIQIRFKVNRVSCYRLYITHSVRGCYSLSR